MQKALQSICMKWRLFSESAGLRVNQRVGRGPNHRLHRKDPFPLPTSREQASWPAATANATMWMVSFCPSGKKNFWCYALPFCKFRKNETRIRRKRNTTRNPTTQRTKIKCMRTSPTLCVVKNYIFPDIKTIFFFILQCITGIVFCR